jgi:hypothetical protein
LRSSLPSDENNLQLSGHFELTAFRVSATAAHRGIANAPTPAIIDHLRRLCQWVREPLRVHRHRPVAITAGYRSPTWNRAVGGSPTSHHLPGRAADSSVPGMTPLAVCQGRAAHAMARRADPSRARSLDTPAGGHLEREHPVARCQADARPDDL